MNGFVKGAVIDVLNIFQDKLNFTSNLYKHEEVSFGNFHSFNGSVIGTGIVGDVFYKKAHLAVASLTITKSRFEYIDYLFPMWEDRIGLYVRTKDISHKMDMNLFFSPFQIYVWITICISAFIIAFIKSTIVEENHKICGSFLYFLSSLKAFFGVPPSQNIAFGRDSHRLIVFVSLLFGQIVWVSYNAFLTSELAITEESLPFKDLESLSETEWRYFYCTINQSVPNLVIPNLTFLLRTDPDIPGLSKTVPD